MEWLIGLICLVLLGLFVESWQQVEEEHKRKLEQEEAEHKLKLELKRKAGLDPLYQKLRKRNQILFGISVFLTSCVVTAIFINLNLDPLDESTTLQSTSPIAIPEKTDVIINNEVSRVSTPNSKQPDTLETQPLNFQHSYNHDGAISTYNYEDNYPSKSKIENHNISVFEASNFIGKDKIVCGEVIQKSLTNKATYINFGQAYPKQVFSGVVWNNSDIAINEGEYICISGLIESYKGVPQIIIHSVDEQIQYQ